MILKDQAFAKINLFLNVTAKREDGYHDIQSIMQTVSLSDMIAIELNDGESNISLTCTDPSVPTDESNLAVKAVNAFYEAAGLEVPDVAIAIDKKIPQMAGLGGGSADAAAVLRMLNRAHENCLSESDLIKAASQIGADVAFCLKGGTALCQGIGDKLTACPALPECHFVIAVSKETSSTKEAYEKLDQKYGAEWPDVESSFSAMMLAIADGRLDGICQNGFNIFESVVLPGSKILGEIRRILTDCGALSAMMSGSGTALFGVFADQKKATIAGDILSAFGYKTSVCVPIKY